MAITLDELLGRNTQTTQQSVERFPSYEEFQSARSYNSAQNNAGQTLQYNYENAVMRQARPVENVRNYDVQRPYVLPQQSEYQTQDYAFYNNLRPQMQETVAYKQPVQMPQQMPVQQVEPMTYQQTISYQQPVQMPQSLYEFTAQDTDRLSEQELLSRLEHTQAQVSDQKKASVFSRAINRVKSKEKTHARLNAKGKVIVALYLAVIAVVVSLVAVNASKINHGQALTPTSRVEIVETMR